MTEVGYDRAKQIKGRLRHVLVNTLGLLAVVTAANLPERTGAKIIVVNIYVFTTSPSKSGNEIPLDKLIPAPNNSVLMLVPPALPTPNPRLKGVSL